ncbi:MAG: hypothetical protein E6I81_01115 [Chloroflexi bacterium]|nr:MAG: hypothetical protein AUI15_27360 [Actinobacteria bacterium 13_2_20CM_2_66_6]TMD74348.1 MAG: hypothetical protein E6I81_01115 [Chloroflexota bacterium]
MIDALTTVCVVVAVAIGTSQLVKEGLQEFLYRPPGVGASPSVAAPGANAAETPPEVAQIVPTQPSPTPQPIQRRVHSGSEVKRDPDRGRPYR